MYIDYFSLGFIDEENQRKFHFLNLHVRKLLVVNERAFLLMIASSFDETEDIRSNIKIDFLNEIYAEP